MLITVERTDKTSERTIGLMHIDGQWVSYTLEDAIHDGPKIAGRTAIPGGNYNVIITHSNRFNKRLPLLENVPGFEGVRIHSGNSAKDTAGCVLVGLNRTSDTVTQSRMAMDLIQPMIQRALDGGHKVTLNIQ